MVLSGSLLKYRVLQEMPLKCLVSGVYGREFVRMSVWFTEVLPQYTKENLTGTPPISNDQFQNRHGNGPQGPMVMDH